MIYMLKDTIIELIITQNDEVKVNKLIDNMLAQELGKFVEKNLKLLIKTSLKKNC